MKEIFIIWVTIQLIIIGVTSVRISNEVATFNYDCNKPSQEVPVWYGAAVPLYAFVPTPQYVIDYCDKNKAVQDE